MLCDGIWRTLDRSARACGLAVMNEIWRTTTGWGIVLLSRYYLLLSEQSRGDFSQENTWWIWEVNMFSRKVAYIRIV